jgi:heme/copper-type cytochrome/quinol oxidase subunit 1
MPVTDTAKLVQTVAPTDRSGIRRLAVANIAVSVAAFGVAAAMALMQALSRANLDLPFRTADMYYMSVTAHGTLMALVFTTFFIMGFGYVVAERSLGRPVPYRAVGVGIVLAGRRRHPLDRHGDSQLQGDGPVHVLSAA